MRPHQLPCLSRRGFLKTAGSLAASSLPVIALGRSASQPAKGRGFDVRSTQETGWNIFVRKGESTDPADIAVNHAYLDHLSQSGVNWLLVFWTNAPQFDRAWAEASQHAHSIGLHLARAVHGFGGGGPETSMAEPNVPRHLLRPSARGPNTALCPHDDETRRWVADALAQRIQPNMDGILIEPARQVYRNCICDKCRTLRSFQWDAFVVTFMAERLRALKPELKIMLHLNMAGADRAAKQAAAADLTVLPPAIEHIFAWGLDDPASLVDWLDADPRFEAFTKLSRVLLFPDGKLPKQPAEQRVAEVFQWCRLAADRGKKGHSFDWRIFGGREWEGHQTDLPTTRLCRKMPASLAIMGAAMRDPYLDDQRQRELLQTLRTTSEWDLDDPSIFYHGV